VQQERAVGDSADCPIGMSASARQSSMNKRQLSGRLLRSRKVRRFRRLLPIESGSATRAARAFCSDEVVCARRDL